MSFLESTPLELCLSIAGYAIVEQLYWGHRSVVYRAVHTAQEQAVVIKVLRSEYPSFGELVQFRNQYTIAKHLPIATVVRPLRLEQLGRRYAIIMEDEHKISLKKYVQNHPLTLEEILRIAIQLAQILQDLSQCRVIHKDIKPANILIHPITQKIKLIDFSIASCLPKETQELKNPNGLEGTLAYLAPEQSGRMNRGIDYRADFYALGVTLFELLTGKLPFPSLDAMELLHCHLAQQPPLVHTLNPNIPPILSTIVAQLMAKNPEDRYQSASGLNHDLQTCLDGWITTGTIAPFELRQRDLSDRFTIPEKLYGREMEVQSLLNAFDRVAAGTSELMLVAGFSGIGKTAIVNEIHKTIARQRGYFVKGKFDQFNCNVPLSAFVNAFRDLMHQLLSESDTALASWKTKILVALGNNAQVMVELIPELEHIIGPQPPAPDLSGTAAQNRFNLLIQKLIQSFSSPAHPLVIFIDDLQWVDSDSLNLIEMLLTDNQNTLLLIGAYRDNEVFAAHPLRLTLDAMRNVGATIHTIALQPLNQSSIHAFIADTLHCPEQLALPLSQVVMQKTGGNPFFAIQLLKSLHQERLITLDVQAGHWQYDLIQIQNAVLIDNIVEFIATQLQKLPEITQTTLKLAACIGAQFDLQTLAIVSQRSQFEVATALLDALQVGLILPQSENYKLYLGKAATEIQINPEGLRYKFLHDRVQQAAYSLISNEHKQATHLQIGQLLLRSSSPTEQNERLFEIVNHFSRGVTLLTSPQEYVTLAELNLTAGRKAKTATAYGAAINYLCSGIKLLSEYGWQSHYSLMLALHQEITEATYLDTDFEQMEQWALVVLQHAKTVLDTSKVQQTRIMAIKAQGKYLDALQLGLAVLQSLGIDFPTQPTQNEIKQAFNVSRSLWVNNPPMTLLNLPPMQDPLHLATMDILTVLVSSAYVSGSNLMSLLIFKQIELSIQFGNCPTSVFAYGDYGIILCGIINDIDNGYEFGQLSLRLREQLQLTSFKARNLFIVHEFINHWKNPLSETLAGLAEASRSGIETGDIEVACLGLAGYGDYAYYAGQELTQLNQSIETYRKTIDRYKDLTSRTYQNICQQTILNLLGQAEVPYQLTGTVFSQENLYNLQQRNYGSGLFYWYQNQSILYYIFGRVDGAVQTSAQAAQYLDGGMAMFRIVIYFFFDALIQLSQYADVGSDQQATILLRVQQHQDKLQHWSALAPMNHQHRWELVTAEKNRVLGDKAAAIEYYDRAINSARSNHFIQDEALANELTAKFYLSWGKEKVAASYMQEAYYCYVKWGAKAKTDDLETRYPVLLHSILQQADLSIGLLSTLMTVSPVTVSVHSHSRPGSSKTSINTAIDFAAILQASQALSGTIHFDKLLHQLTQIILQNSGADRCVLLLPSNTGEWQVRTIATLKSTEVCTQPLSDNLDLPVKLIQYVKNSQEVAVIDDYKVDSPIIDPYLQREQPQSVLCLPLLNQGQMIGIVYLSNQTTSGVFTYDRILILNFLCTQAAISLKNAQLYQQLQQSENQYRAFVEDVNDIIYAITPEGTFSYLSPQFKEILGYEVADYLHQPFTTIAHPEDMAKINASMAALYARGEKQGSLEFRVRHQTGHWIWLMGNNAPIFDEDGHIVGMRGIARDISKQAQLALEREQAQLQLAKLNRQLAIANQELIRATQLKDEFLATMSHELRTPLNAILGMTEVLQENILGPVNERQLKSLQTIDRSASHLLELINDILDVSKIVSGQFELECAPTAIVPLCHRSLEYIQSQALKKNLQLIQHIPDNLPDLHVDERRMRQVLINLLSNAVKFTPDGGSITLEVIPPSAIDPKRADSHLHIAVSDTGIGIAPEYLETLFQPFIQIDSALNRQYEGTGLGLALVKSLVELHGGQVDVTSEVGKGSRFTIVLPYNQSIRPTLE